MASQRIKGITIEIGADTSQLTKALASVDRAAKATKTNLSDINRALKLDPTNVNLLKDKQNELKDAVAQAKQKLDTEKQALEQMRNTEGFDANSKAAKDLQLQIDLDTAALEQAQKALQDFGSVGAQQLRAVGEHLQEVGSKIKAVGDSIANVGAKLTATFTVPIVAAGTKAVASFAEVDKTMTLVNATMGNTAEQADLMNDAMEQAAANSTFGMNDAAQASLNFARAGLTAEQAAAALAPAMNLAAGEAGELDTVSNGLVATINGFGDSFDEAEHYADVFAAACNNSALDVNTLSESMSVAAPIFNTAGKSVEDAALMLGVMANSGIEANVAANSLKTGMARLAEPTKQAKEAMEKYGIAMGDIWNADGSMKDMTTIQQNLHQAFAQLSEQEQMAAAGAIFGKNQMSSWLAVINSAPEDVQKLNDAIKESGPLTQEMADAMMGGFGGSIEKLKSSLDVLMTSLGRVIAQYLTPIIEKIQGVVDAFNAMDDAQKNQIVKIAAIVAAIGPALVIIGKVVASVGTVISAIGKISSLLGSIGPIISAITGPIGIAVAAIAALTAAFVYLYKNNEGFRESMQAVFAKLQETFANVVETVKPAIENIIEAFKGIMDALAPVFEFLFERIAGIVNAVMEAVGPLSEVISSIITYISEIVQAFSSLLKGDFDGFFEHLKNALSAAIDYVKSMIQLAIASIKIFFSQFGIDIGAIFNGIKNTVLNIWNAIKTTVSSIVTNLVNTAVNLFNKMKNGISTTCSNIKSAVVNGFTNAISYIKSLPSQALQWGKDIINGIINGIKNAISGLKTTMSNVANTIKSYIHFSEPDVGPLKDFNTYMPDMMKQIAQGITAGIPLIDSAMEQMTKNMLPTIGGSASGATTNNTSNQVSINVYGAQGQDVSELAEIVQQKIIDNTVRQGVVFA